MVAFAGWNIIQLLVSSLLLAGFAHLLIRILMTIARFLQISEYSTAFILMATATSIPELFVGVTSAIANQPSIGLGTVIGSNILDLTLIIGIALLIGRSVKIKSKEVKADSLWMTGLCLLPLALMVIGNSLSRLDGAILILLFFVYQRRVFIRGRRFKKPLKNHVSKFYALASAFFLILTVVGLFLSARWVVASGLAVAQDFFIPPILLGIVVLALGTSLPELAFETASVLNGRGEMALGDAIGSVITNSTLVVGITALIYPISSNFLIFSTSAAFLAAIAVLFTSFVEGEKLTWRVGVGLILLYIFFLIVELQLKGVVG